MLLCRVIEAAACQRRKCGVKRFAQQNLEIGRIHFGLFESNPGDPGGSQTRWGQQLHKTGEGTGFDLGHSDAPLYHNIGYIMVAAEYLRGYSPQKGAFVPYHETKAPAFVVPPMFGAAGPRPRTFWCGKGTAPVSGPAGGAVSRPPAADTLSLWYPSLVRRCGRYLLRRCGIIIWGR